MKKIWNALTLVSLAWGAYIVLAGLWDLGRDIAEDRRLKAHFKN